MYKIREINTNVILNVVSKELVIERIMFIGLEMKVNVDGASPKERDREREK